MIAREHGHRRNEACALANYAEALGAAGFPDKALSLLETWQIDPARDAAYTITHHLDTRGGICLALGRFDEAASLFSQALEVAEMVEEFDWGLIAPGLAITVSIGVAGLLPAADARLYEAKQAGRNRVSMH